MIELGIDEAGRGPILGPLVMAGILVPEDKKEMLREWGIDDSKSFGSGKKAKQIRNDLAGKIADTFRYKIVVISSHEVDDYVEKHSLNYLEQKKAMEIIDALPSDKVVLDGQNLFGPITNEKIFAFNKADQTYVSVGAASVLAKAERDRLFELICGDFEHEFGEIKGGGYANKKTLEFVDWYLKKNGELPPFYRKSYQWKYLDSVSR